MTLSYAQSLDGSIADAASNPMRISDDSSMELTHELRAIHDGILVGVGTVISDNPRLTVRHASGTNPRPIVLDTKLRCPCDASIFNDKKASPLIYTSSSNEDRKEALEAAGAVVQQVRAGSGGVSIADVRRDACRRGIDSIMVEGGACVIRHMIMQRHVQKLVVTLAPMYVSGLNPLDGCATEENPKVPTLHAMEFANVMYQWAGEDIVLFADPKWPDA